MNAASVKFFLCSLCIHFVLFWLLWQKGSIEYGVVAAKPGLSSVPIVWTTKLVPEPGTSVYAMPQLVSAVADTQAIPALPMDVQKSDPLAKPDPAAVQNQEYLIAGQLTRLPVPITDIDLNVAGLNDNDVTGKVELTVLIDVAGRVVDAIPAVQMESARVFAERVAQRFRVARFRPGEINGKAVNAQLRITVVSESLAKNGSQAEIDGQ